MGRRDRPLLLLLVLVLLLLLMLLLFLAHVADALPNAAALRVAGRHQFQNLLRALLARPEPARRRTDIMLQYMRVVSAPPQLQGIMTSKKSEQTCAVDIAGRSKCRSAT